MTSKRKRSTALSTACGFCIQGDVGAAHRYLEQLPNKSKREEKFMNRMFERFFSNHPADRIKSRVPWIRDVIKAYNRYFQAVLTKSKSASVAETSLLLDLQKFVLGNDMESVEAQLKEEFFKRGFRFLGGITQPYFGPYIWKTEQIQIFDVEIPSGIEQVRVHFMDDFLMLSWLDYASLGLVSAGGWASDEGLFCVYERYKSTLVEPEFTISYLKHEAQHFADYRMFPSLTPFDLEYRAKLVELIYYPTKEKLFDFLTYASKSPENAHAFAAYVVVTRLSQMLQHCTIEFQRDKWDAVSLSEINRAAMQLFEEHTSELLSGKLHVVL